MFICATIFTERYILKANKLFHQLGPTGPSWSRSRHVRGSVCLSVCLRHRVPGEQRRSQGSKAVSHCFQSMGTGPMLSISRNVRPSVCPSVCPSVRPSVRLFTFEVPFKRLFAPNSQSPMSKLWIFTNYASPLLY